MTKPYVQNNNTQNQSSLDAIFQGSIVDANGKVLLEDRYHVHMDPSIGAEPRGLTPEAMIYETCGAP